MKLFIHNKGKGWFAIGNNYKDKNDVAFLGLFFPKQTAPIGDKACIEIKSAKLTSFKRQIGLTVFEYDLIENNNENLADKVEEFKQDNNINPINVQQEDLPFYGG